MFFVGAVYMDFISWKLIDVLTWFKALEKILELLRNLVYESIQTKRKEERC